MWIFLFSGFILGLGSSLHCAGMCGPLVLTMPFQRPDGAIQIRAVLEYHLGKTLSYALFGGIFGFFGMGLKLVGFQQWFSVIFGILLLLFLIGPKINSHAKDWKNKLMIVWSKYISLLFKINNRKTFILLGMSNGLIPCGVVYVALAASVMGYSPGLSMAFMAFFGFGTIPILTLIIGGSKLFKPKRFFSYTKLGQVATLLLALLFILRGLNLDIPFLSPKLADNHHIECCKRH
ncbi:MAG: sulfite exporter TauE/SafE family protein [Saprospiraceae bacterium]|nr:sulfite exporter TauE/SafE family protein [Saprospiraceae bacterium]